MLGLLIGRLGITKADALSFTREEMEAVVRHGVDREKEEWKRYRWLATILVNISGKSVKHRIKETDLMKFTEEKKSNGFADFVKAAHELDHKNTLRS